MTVAATPLPFVLAGGLKIVYDLALFFGFRSADQHAIVKRSYRSGVTSGGSRS